jgi:hypothetical protein
MAMMKKLSSGYCCCAQVNAIIPGTAMVDEQTSSLNLVSLVGDAANSRIMDQIVKRGRFFWRSRSWLLVLSS